GRQGGRREERRTAVWSLPRARGRDAGNQLTVRPGPETRTRLELAIDDRHIGGGHARVRAVAAVEYRVDGRGRRTGAGDVAGQVVVAVAAPHPAPQGTGAPGGQIDGGRDRVVALSAPGLEVEPAVQLARVAHRDLVGPVAPARPQIRAGPGGDRAGDGEG